MPDYGVTPSGVSIKRLDAILDELHNELTAGWGVNTRLNPKSLLNVLLTAFADKIAELWELGQQTYYSQYPGTAEGISLDNAALFGGSYRLSAAQSIYTLHCVCIDGTVIPKGTRVASNTNPPVNFLTLADQTVTREAFNAVGIVAAVVQNNSLYSFAADGELYSYTSSASATAREIAEGLEAAIVSDEFTASVEGDALYLRSKKPDSVHSLVLSGNLTTSTVTGLVEFRSEEYGDIYVPDGTIQTIVTAVPGFESCDNLTGYVAGRLRETDIQLRESYVKKIFGRSSGMLDSIRSTILQEVQGIIDVNVYENDTDVIDDMGRPPHSVEVVVDGGSEREIARVIYNTKAGGIATFGDVAVELIDDNGDPFIVRFNRPFYVYVWFKVLVTMSDEEPLPADYVDLIKESILSQMSKVVAGVNVVQQKFIADIYRKVPGITYLEIPVWYTEDSSASPPDYTENVIDVTPRQRAITDYTRIEVVLVE